MALHFHLNRFGETSYLNILVTESRRVEMLDNKMFSGREQDKILSSGIWETKYFGDIYLKQFLITGQF